METSLTHVWQIEPQTVKTELSTRMTMTSNFSITLSHFTDNTSSSWTDSAPVIYEQLQSLKYFCYSTWKIRKMQQNNLRLREPKSAIHHWSVGKTLICLSYALGP